jgi:hypothetical protein
MKKTFNLILSKSLWLIDIILLPFVFFSAIVLKFYRYKRFGVTKLPLSTKTLLNIGIFPLKDQYYEPLINTKNLKPIFGERNLPAIDWNVKGQLEILNAFHFQSEFDNIPDYYINDNTFNFKNTSYEEGDAEYWYNIIRLKKPERIIEIGSGNSTKIARLAIKFNQDEDPGYQCQHICIEPYEMAWLEKTGVEVMRKKVEDIDLDFFRQLQENDVLFIDSSHIIRPQGDVLYEYLEILPILNTGVIVHIHDIFSPRDYPQQWIVEEHRFWNEQYLLEAFLSFNSNWKILGAVNFLSNNYFDLLKEKCPRLFEGKEPGAFYIVKL